MYGGGAYNPNPTSYTGTGGPISPSHPAASRPIIPIVVSMIGRLITHSEGNFQYFDTSISTISVCGIICNVKQGSSERKSFTIHDGTGAIQATFYVQNDGQQFAMDGYVRIIGTLRQFQDKVEISGYHCDPISSFNEITIHYLSCIQSYLYFKKRSNPAINSTSSAMNTSDSDDLETKILKYIRMNQQQNGSSTSQFDLMQRFESQGYDRSAVEFALKTLTEEMKVYMPEPDSYTCDLCVCLKEEIEEEGNMVGQYCLAVGNHGMDERLVILLLFAHPHSMQLYNRLCFHNNHPFSFSHHSQPTSPSHSTIFNKHSPK